MSRQFHFALCWWLLYVLVSPPPFFMISGRPGPGHTVGTVAAATSAGGSSAESSVAMPRPAAVQRVICLLHLHGSRLSEHTLISYPPPPPAGRPLGPSCASPYIPIYIRPCLLGTLLCPAQALPVSLQALLVLSSWHLCHDPLPTNSAGLISSLVCVGAAPLPRY